MRGGEEERSCRTARLLLFQRVRLPSTQRPRQLRRTSTAPAWPVDQLQRCSTVPCGKVPLAKGTVGSRASWSTSHVLGCSLSSLLTGEKVEFMSQWMPTSCVLARSWCFCFSVFPVFFFS